MSCSKNKGRYYLVIYNVSCFSSNDKKTVPVIKDILQKAVKIKEVFFFLVTLILFYLATSSFFLLRRIQECIPCNVGRDHYIAGNPTRVAGISFYI